MAKRRMFSLDVVDTDCFLDLPASSQALYFHLGMRADDDGFVASPRKITKLVNCGEDDLKLLFAKELIIPFESGVCVVRDWRINNHLQNDRYHETIYQDEKGQLALDSSKRWILDMEPKCIQDVSNLEPQDSIGKAREGQTREGKTRVGEGYRGEPGISGPDDFDHLRNDRLEMLDAYPR